MANAGAAGSFSGGYRSTYRTMQASCIWAEPFALCNFPPQVRQPNISTVALNQILFSVLTRSPALVAGDAQHIEFADEIAEDDCAVARHFDRHVNIRNYTCPTRVGLYGIKVRVFSQRQRM